MKEQGSTEIEIRKTVEQMLGNDELFVVGVHLKGHTGASKLTVQIDGDSDVSIETCSDISRKLSAFLDDTDMIGGAYTLEVSSPGLDQPLSNVRQYRKNVGRILKVKTEGQKVVRGILKEVGEQSIRLEVSKGKKKETEDVLLPFDEIKSATVEVAFK